MSAVRPPNLPHHGPGCSPCCPSCGKELTTFHERHENICSELKCRGPWLQRKTAEANQKIETQQAALTNGAQECLREYAAETFHKTASGEYLLIVVPSIEIEGELAPQSVERIAAFRKLLEEAMVEAQQLATKLLAICPGSRSRSLSVLRLQTFGLTLE